MLIRTEETLPLLRSPRDALSRPLRDLRLSVLDRCNFRCSYCMPEESLNGQLSFLPRKSLLNEPYDPQALEQFIRRTWAGRDDRYSEIRDLQSPAGKGPEMYRMGG